MNVVPRPWIDRQLKISGTTGDLFVPKCKMADYWLENSDNKGRLLWSFFSKDCRHLIMHGTHEH